MRLQIGWLADQDVIDGKCIDIKYVNYVMAF